MYPIPFVFSTFLMNLFFTSALFFSLFWYILISEFIIPAYCQLALPIHWILFSYIENLFLQSFIVSISFLLKYFPNFCWSFYSFDSEKKLIWGWGDYSVLEHLCSIWKALISIPSATNRNNNNKNKTKCYFSCLFTVVITNLSTNID